MDAPTAEASDGVAALAGEVRLLREEVAALARQTAYLAARARAQEGREREWDDLKSDLTPVAHDVYCLAVEELTALEPHVHLEDVVRLLRRLARNTRTLEAMLDRLESVHDLLADAVPLTNDAFQQAAAHLDGMERKGYFGFARESWRVVDNVVSAFSEDDVRQLGDNIVLILRAVREMTQPEVMAMVRSLSTTYRGEVVAAGPPGSVSLLSLLRQTGDPEVRRGLAMAMTMLRVMARRADGTEPASAKPEPGTE